MRYRVSIFTLVPHHGSHGVGPCQPLEDGVSETSTLQEGEGYLDSNQSSFRELNSISRPNLSASSFLVVHILVVIAMLTVLSTFLMIRGGEASVGETHVVVLAE